MEKVYIVLGEGYADWETALIAAELNNGAYGLSVQTIGPTCAPLHSMGGFTVTPALSIDEAITNIETGSENLAILILCGGLHWKKPAVGSLNPLITTCLKKHIPVAAICDAVTFLAEKGFLDSIRHTGNTLEYIQEMAPHYLGEAYFVEAQAVTDGNIITANGLAPLEFSREILRLLHLTPDTDYGVTTDSSSSSTPDAVSRWYNAWKCGYYPNT